MDQKQTQDDGTKTLGTIKISEELSGTVSHEGVDNSLRILNCIQFLLRSHGIEKSIASIRDDADASEGPFDMRDAVSTLRHVEFSANVGKLSVAKLTQGHCPCVVSVKDDKFYVLVEISDEKGFVAFNPDDTNNMLSFTKKEFKKVFTGGVLLAKSRKQNREVSDSKERKVDWFWGSLA